jgi:hypothetical protein
MKKWAVLFILLFPTATAFANPIVIDADVWFRLGIILVAAFSVETLVVTTILYFCHMEFIPTLIAIFVGNFAIYFIIFKPILLSVHNVMVAELLIVAVEGIFIKIISSIDTFQLEEFKELKWPTAIIISAVGNAMSYFSGLAIGR